jgi:hypothetical protein
MGEAKPISLLPVVRNRQKSDKDNYFLFYLCALIGIVEGRGE